MSYVCPHCHRFPPEDNIWKKQCHLWRAACGMQHSAKPSVAKVFSGARPAAGIVRDFGVCSQVVGEPVDGRKQPRGHAVRGVSGAWQIKITDELRKFIQVDIHEAVKTRDLEKQSPQIRQKKCFQMQQHAKGFYELTLRKSEEGMLPTKFDTTNVGTSEWGPRRVDED